MDAKRTDQLRALVVETPARLATGEASKLIDDMALAVVRQKSGQDVTDRHALDLMARYSALLHLPQTIEAA